MTLITTNYQIANTNTEQEVSQIYSEAPLIQGHTVVPANYFNLFGTTFLNVIYLLRSDFIIYHIWGGLHLQYC